MVYGYVRVSTEKQTVQNQKMEIRRFCKERKLRKVQWVAETVSGTKSPDKRKLGALLKTVGENDIIVCTEISRLGRSMMMIFDVLNKLMTVGVKVYTIKENYELGDNIQSQVLAFAFGLSAQIERDLISERTKMGLERVRKEMKKRRIAFLAVFFAMAMAVFAASGTVYVTASGAKYHHRDCRTLAKSKNVYSMTVAACLYGLDCSAEIFAAEKDVERISFVFRVKDKMNSWNEAVSFVVDRGNFEKINYENFRAQVNSDYNAMWKIVKVLTFGGIEERLKKFNRATAVENNALYR